MTVQFEFLRDTPQYKHTVQGAIVRNGVFPKGSAVPLSGIRRQYLPGEVGRIETFEVWLGGNPYYFKVTEAGIPDAELSVLRNQLTTYFPEATNGECDAEG